MALPENVPVETLVLDKPYRLAFTLGAMRRLRNLPAVADESAWAYERIGATVWALIADKDVRDGLSPEAVEDMIAPGMIAGILETLDRLKDASQPDAPKGDSEEGNPPEGGDGSPPT